MLDEILAHRHERRRAARGEVEAPEQLLARRLDRLQQRLQVCRAWRVLLVGLEGGRMPRLVGSEAAGEQAEELEPGRHRQAA